MTKLKTALLITGAAARISQEVALIDVLIEKHGLKINQDDTYLAGFSSGSLNVAAINACFRDKNPKDWKEFYKKGTLFSIETNEEIYIKQKPLPWDTAPLRKKLDKFLKDSDFSKDSDFPFNTDIIVCHKKNIICLNTYWVNTRNEAHQNIKTSDLLMASCAIPAIFPLQEIHALPDKSSTGLHPYEYCDGGTNGTFNDFDYILGEIIKKNKAIFENLFIVSPMREMKKAEAKKSHKHHFTGLKNKIIKKILEELFGHVSMEKFIKFLNTLEAANTNPIKGGPNLISEHIYVSMPNLEKNADILDFYKQKDKYDEVYNWAENNPDACMTLHDFIKFYEKLI